MKLLKITLLLLFLIISMGLVSAQDSANDTVHADISPTADVGLFTDLEKEINSANGTVEITKDYINDNYSEGIKIVKDNIVINGNNHTLDGNNQAILYTAGENITINNLIFRNGQYSFGAAIYNSGLLILNNVTFINNAASSGSAISNFGEIDLRGGLFINNSADNGGALINNGQMSLSGAVFINNSAVYGGALINNGQMGLSDGVFINNSAVYGGALANIWQLSLSGAVFINNSGEIGGAVNNGEVLDLRDAVFINNSGEIGGAVNNEGVLDLRDAVFINNSADNGGALFNTGSADLDGTCFISNSAHHGGGIFDCSDICCKNSKFTDNEGVIGSAIYMKDALGRAEFDECSFESKYLDKYGLFFVSKSNLRINNSVFANSSAEYAPAIILWSAYGIIINNTQFINLKASQSAGAVAAYGYENITVENSLFANTSCAKNGGAIFIDQDDMIRNEKCVNIYGCSFINSSGNFGGAFLQLAGNLTVFNSTFAECSSNYDGGAVYLSGVVCEIRNSSFISNKNGNHDDYPTYGGAIYFDYGKLNISSSKFINNSAFETSGTIGIYDALYHISDSSFDAGEAVYATFKRNGSDVVNCIGNYSVCDGNVLYPQVIAGSGRELMFITNEINVETLPVRFDLRDFNWNTSVYNQAYSSACWAFALDEALESALLKSSALNIAFSVNNMQNTMLSYSKYGSVYNGSGINLIAAGYLLSWLGPILQENDTFDEFGKISPVFEADIHVQDIIFLSNISADNGNLDILKRAILNYGAIDCEIYGNPAIYNMYPYYDSKTAAQYVPSEIASNHAVAVVGWDDTFSADNFAITPPGDGAWICQNSYGEELGMGGYFYVSYYDKTIALRLFGALGILFENNVSYNKNYQYDFRGLMNVPFVEWKGKVNGTVTYANRFTAVDDDLIAAVGTYFRESGVNCTIRIEVNGETLLTQEGVSPYGGYHTIKLNTYVPLKKGDEFTVYVTSNALPLSKSPRVKYEANVSMFNYLGNWEDLYAKYGVVACIKAYTVEDDSKIIANNDISLDYVGGKCFSVKVVTGDGIAVGGCEVKFKINSEISYVKTDKNGIAEIRIDNVPGKYAIKTVYNGKTYTNRIVVKQVLSASKVTVKKTAKKFTLKAKLKINGKMVKGKWIKFKFKGKTYKVKTNSKGIAQKSLGKNVIKKLKKGKTYAVKVSYLKDTITSTVKVK